MQTSFHLQPGALIIYTYRCTMVILAPKGNTRNFVYLKEVLAWIKYINLNIGEFLYYHNVNNVTTMS